MTERKHIDLFTGAGGLALGCHMAGFDPFIYVDNDRHCFDTLAANGQTFHKGAIITKRDVKTLDWDDQQTEIALLSGGVPCQPWSNGGVSKGWEDERNLWPDFLRCMGGVMPKAVIAENVSGILRPQFKQYLGYVMRAMKSPKVKRWNDEPWESHSKTLASAGGKAEQHYDVYLLELDAQHYGVPQKRKRVFLIAFRRDLGVDWGFNYDYWWRTDPTRKWTLRNAIGSLPDPREIELEFPTDHIYVPGAREYRGHRPNELDKPCKTIKAGVHGMPGGEGVVRLDDGSIRYLTVRELARIQTFPDDYQFAGSRSQQIKQIGNAVPVNLAYRVAEAVYYHLGYK